MAQTTDASIEWDRAHADLRAFVDAAESGIPSPAAAALSQSSPSSWTLNSDDNDEGGDDDDVCSDDRMHTDVHPAVMYLQAWRAAQTQHNSYLHPRPVFSGVKTGEDLLREVNAFTVLMWRFEAELADEHKHEIRQGFQRMRQEAEIISRVEELLCQNLLNENLLRDAIKRAQTAEIENVALDVLEMRLAQLQSEKKILKSLLRAESDGDVDGINLYLRQLDKEKKQTFLLPELADVLNRVSKFDFGNRNLEFPVSLRNALNLRRPKACTGGFPSHSSSDCQGEDWQNPNNQDDVHVSIQSSPMSSTHHSNGSSREQFSQEAVASSAEDKSHDPSSQTSQSSHTPQESEVNHGRKISAKRVTINTRRRSSIIEIGDRIRRFFLPDSVRFEESSLPTHKTGEVPPCVGFITKAGFFTDDLDMCGSESTAASTARYSPRDAVSVRHRKLSLDSPPLISETSRQPNSGHWNFCGCWTVRQTDEVVLSMA